MSEDKKCLDCGAVLSQNKTCTACLLALGLDSLSGHGQNQEWIEPTVDDLSQYFPELEILSLLGRGGMGAVYKARQKSLNRLVAIKVLPPDIGDDLAFEGRFSREAQALASLNHPNIVTIHDFGQRDGLFFFMMEFVDGVNLRELLEQSKISPREALVIVPQICDALQSAHDQGVVHRDIKPDNILMDQQGRVKIADFGLAKLIDLDLGVDELGNFSDSTEKSYTIAAVGTPSYMAPEQRKNLSDVDHRVDIYALGVVFYQMLTGELPAEKIECPSKKVVLDQRLDKVVLQALAEKPQGRYQEAEALKTDLEVISKTKARRSYKKIIASMFFLFTFIVLSLFVNFPAFDSSSSSLEDLSRNPSALRKVKTSKLIEVALFDLEGAWAWQELERRIDELSPLGVTKLIEGLTRELLKDYPNGYSKPLSWSNDFLNTLSHKKMLTEEQALNFLTALNGSPSLELPRLKEGAESIDIEGRLSCSFNQHLLGMKMLNQLKEIRLDGRAIKLTNSSFNRGGAMFYSSIKVPALSAGEHSITYEIDSAFVDQEDARGLSSKTLAVDWPATQKRWLRKVTVHFNVFKQDAELIKLLDTPEFDPIKNKKMSLRKVALYADSSKNTNNVVFFFDYDQKRDLSVAFKAKIKLGNTIYPCGSFYEYRVANFSVSGGSPGGQTPRIDPKFKTVTVILTPRPKLVERDIRFTEIWGKEIILKDIPLIRHDLASRKDKE